MKKLLLLLILAISTTIAFSQSENPNDIHKRITISNPTQETLNTLQDIGIDLRCGVEITDEQIQLEVPSFELNLIESKGISYEVEIEDVSKFYKERIDKTYEVALKDLELEKSRNQAQRPSVSSIVLDNFLEYTGCDEIDWATPTNFELGSMGGCLTVSEMETELDEMRTLYPTLISAKADASSTNQTTWGNPSSSITNNGLTYSGQGTTFWDPKTIYYVRITGDQSSLEGTKPQSLFTSMIHSREVGSLMSNIYFMWYLLENYATDDAVKNLVDNNELYFIPVVNPDGLRWNEHLNSGGSGLQRKNCRPNTGPTTNGTSLRGVDLNRNFDYFWGSAGLGSSPIPGSDLYRGPSAFSEPETQILKGFVESRDFKTCLMNHTAANSIPHPYGGNPTFVSGREDEMHKWHEDMTRYNRYVSGATIFVPANGIADDWMVGGAADSNGKTGSTKTVLATTPEHGNTGFWPPTTDIVPIAKRSMRLSFTTAYYAGKYAKFHDLTQSDVSTLSSNLTFGIERLGQTASDFTLTVTPISANIVSITSPATEVGMAILEQKNVTAVIILDGGISANDKIEYRVQLANGDGIVFYDVNYEKYYLPTVLFSHDPDTDGLTGWTQSGGWNNSSVSAYSGSDALRTGDAVPYANSNTKVLTTTSSYDLSSYPETLVQFYTKWDLERNYDFVELEGSTDGSSWQSICGKYNKPESTSSTNEHNLKGGSSSFQSSNSSGRVYDGDRMDNWVMEEIIIDGSNNSFLSGSSTAQFRFRFKSDTENESENYSTTSDGFFIDDFKIIGIQVPCVPNTPTPLILNSITTTTASASWSAIPSATYDLRYRVVGAGTWIDIAGLTSNSYNFSSLTLLTNYEVQVRSNCGATMSAYTGSEFFTTLSVTYCTSNGNSGADTGVTQVSFNTLLKVDLDNTNTNGYDDFTAEGGASTTTVIQGSTYTLSVNVNTDGRNWVYAFAWIDFNADGDFNGANEVYDLGRVRGPNPAGTDSNLTTNIEPNILIPTDAAIGPIRMRVAARYNVAPTSCATGYDGEVEDYIINIEAVLGVDSELNLLNAINIYPNPVSDQVFVSLPNTIKLLDYKISNPIGQVIMQDKPNNTNTIDVSSINSGIYFLSLNTDKGELVRKIIIN